MTHDMLLNYIRTFYFHYWWFRVWVYYPWLDVWLFRFSYLDFKLLLQVKDIVNVYPDIGKTMTINNRTY